MSPWGYCALLPVLTFSMLLLAEGRSRLREPKSTTSDWILNLTGFAMQGLLIPILGFFLSTVLFPSLLPNLHRCLQLGFTGSFLLNFIGIDFLYYLQHRAFHNSPLLWKLHATHHYAPTVNVWATSRNAIVTNFLFVYLLVSPFVAYLCDSQEGFFVGAMLTAALDLFRHAHVDCRIPVLDQILTMPHEHHRHHDADRPDANFAANFILWDKLFNTFEPGTQFHSHLETQHQKSPPSYQQAKQPALATQLIFPWKL